MELNSKKCGISIILGIKASERRLFFRAQGSYKVEVRGNLGSIVLSEHNVIAKSKEDTVYHLELTDGADFTYLSPLNGQSSKFYFALIAPRKSIDPEIITKDFVTINVQMPWIRTYTDSNLKIEPLWLKNHKRSLPMFIKAHNKTPHILEVKAIPVCPPNKTQTVRLWLNGQLLTEHKWVDCNQPWEAQITISPEQLLEGWNLLEAEAEHGVVPAEVFPGNDDRRTLFVGFQRLLIRPAQ